MKYFFAIALIAAVASADFTLPGPIVSDAALIQEILEAIHSPNTDPATAAALEQMLIDILGLNPVSIEPALIDFPVTDIGEAVEDIVEVSPVGVVDSAKTPLVQIILNINQAALAPSPVVPEPVQIIDVTPVEVADQPSPVQVVDIVPPKPVQVVDLVPPKPVQVVDIVPPKPVQVVDIAPIAVEPVLIGTPVIASPAVQLN